LLFELSKRGLADALADALTIHCPDQVGIRIDIEYLLELHTAKPGLGIRAMAKAAKVTNDIDNRNVIINALRRAFASLDEGEKDSVFVDKCIRWLDAHKVKLNLDYMPQGPRLDNHTHPPLFIEQK
jgi:hypothetical protein